MVVLLGMSVEGFYTKERRGRKKGGETQEPPSKTRVGHSPEEERKKEGFLTTRTAFGMTGGLMLQRRNPTTRWPI
jgi:hypothetical protein